MVRSSDFDVSTDLEFCETCVGGKHHRSPFQIGTSARPEEPLGLVHSDVTDVCGKLGANRWVELSTS